MKMKQTQCSKTSAIKHHTPVNNPKDYTQHSEQGESLQSRDSIFSNVNNTNNNLLFAERQEE
jgi:hypothetical protein